MCDDDNAYDNDDCDVDGEGGKDYDDDDYDDDCEGGDYEEMAIVFDCPCDYNMLVNYSQVLVIHF